MRRFIVLAAAGLSLFAVDSARASALDLRLGVFAPKAESNLFTDDAELYGTRKRDWRGLTGGAEFNFTVAENVELGLSLDGYSQDIDTFYVDFVNEDGSEILQTLRLRAAPLGVTLRFVPTSRRGSLQPYAAVGGDLFFYKYEEFGDFIDFGDPTRPIIADAFVSEGVIPGVHVAAGLRIPINYDFGITLEGRYQWGSEDLEDDFRAQPGQDPLRLSLEGWSATAGLHIKF